MSVPIEIVKQRIETALSHNAPQVGSVEFDDRLFRKTPVQIKKSERTEIPNEDLVSEHDYQRRIAELESELKEKEKLIELLTKQIEALMGKRK